MAAIMHDRATGGPEPPAGSAFDGAFEEDTHLPCTLLAVLSEVESSRGKTQFNATAMTMIRNPIAFGV